MVCHIIHQVHRNPPVVHIKRNPFQSLPCSLYMIQFNIFLSEAGHLGNLQPSCFWARTTYAFLISCISDGPFVSIILIVSIEESTDYETVSYNQLSLPVWSKYSPKFSVLRHPVPLFASFMWQTKCDTHTEQIKVWFSMFSSLCFWSK